MQYNCLATTSKLFPHLNQVEQKSFKQVFLGDWSYVSLINIFCCFFVVADLKRICETENGSLEIGDHQAQQMLKRNGLSTQCIQAKHAISCKDMTLAQLCLKINAKLGGANNSIANHNNTRLVSLVLTELSFCEAFTNSRTIFLVEFGIYKEGGKGLFLHLLI